MREIISVDRRFVLAAATASMLAPISGFAQSGWPNRAIKLVVPFAPGGSNDNMARFLASKLGARLGQAVIVENRAGGGGTIGTEYVTRSDPDGYTLMFASTSLVTNAAGGKKLPYDLVKDLEPIGGIAASPFAIVVANKVKANTLSEFIALARANPKSINYGSAGIGGINHLGTELFATAAKIQLTHVPYKGIGPAFTDLMGGSLQMLLPSLASVVQFVRGGRMRALAVTGATRSSLAPEIPTVSESGVPGFQLEVWFGLLGPAMMPAPIVKRLNEEMNIILATPEAKEFFAGEGSTPRPSTPQEFSNLIRSELDRWNRLIKDNNIALE